MVMKEKDDELALFLELRRREKEKERDNNFLLLNNSDDGAAHAPFGANPGSSPPASRIVPSTMLPRKTAAEKFLDSENDKSDYDWLLTPPGTPLFPSLEMESHKTMMGQMEMPNARPTALKSRLMNDLDEPAPRNNVAASKRTTLQSGVNSSSAGIRRPSSAGGTRAASRPATPTGRPSLPSTAKPSRASTPTSRATLPLTKPAPPPARSSTPTRTTARSSTPTSTAARSSTPTSTAARSSTPTGTAARSSTPTSTAARSSTPTGTAARSSTPTRTTARPSTPTRTAARSSTPTARPSVPGPKPMPRSATPTRLPSTNPSAPPGRSSSSTKSRPTALKNPVLSRGSSPTVKSRPWKPNEMPGFSHDAPPNLRTSLPQRPASASRGRPGVASARSSSVDTASNGRPRQQSCSPARGRAPIGNANSNRISMPVKSRPQSKNIDDVNPVLMGTQMVERVVNMRKLAPPKHDDHHSTLSGSAGKSSSLDSSGFGRSLSKKSLDMALRHMDIRRSMNSGSLRPLMTNIPASSMYSVRSGGSTRSRSISVSDSPHATSSNSSEPSVNNNNFFADSVDMEDVDFGSERGNSSPTSHRSSR